MKKKQRVEEERKIEARKRAADLRRQANDQKDAVDLEGAPGRSPPLDAEVPPWTGGGAGPGARPTEHCPYPQQQQQWGLHAQYVHISFGAFGSADKGLSTLWVSSGSVSQTAR